LGRPPLASRTCGLDPPRRPAVASLPRQALSPLAAEVSSNRALRARDQGERRTTRRRTRPSRRRRRMTTAGSETLPAHPRPTPRPRSDGGAESARPPAERPSLASLPYPEPHARSRQWLVSTARPAPSPARRQAPGTSRRCRPEHGMGLALECRPDVMSNRLRRPACSRFPYSAIVNLAFIYLS
jgi:hypothetical protein